MSDETAQKGDAGTEGKSPPGDGSPEAGKKERSSGVGHRDLYAIIGIAVVLFGLVILFALACPGAWETGQMMEEEPGQESQATPDEIEPPE